MGSAPYTDGFYERHRAGSRRSAETVAPLLCDLLAPASVVDVGCGVGTWLAAFRALGVEDIWGIDGDWVDRGALEIPGDRFQVADLARPLRVDRTFDVALSLEVAEHLPPECADTFVDSLVGLAPAVVFSAAIPHQGGTNHVNEQWPEYWADRFAARGYRVVDAVRRLIWHEQDVEWYYAQNTLVFVRPQLLQRRPGLADAEARTAGTPLSMVHPRLWDSVAGWSRALIGAVEDVATSVPAQALVVVMDEAKCGPALAAGRPSLPFLERDGAYFGTPADDAVAIEELDRLRRRGAGFLVVAWPAFWWLGHYAAFHRHLRSSFRCVVDNDRTVIFDLSAPAGGGPAGRPAARVPG